MHLAISGFAVRGPSPPMFSALILSGLALLEYVNYYHRQLMNFDRLSDFQRLLRTGRLRRAHMSRDLAVHRKRLQG